MCYLWSGGTTVASFLARRTTAAPPQRNGRPLEHQVSGLIFPRAFSELLEEVKGENV